MGPDQCNSPAGRYTTTGSNLETYGITSVMLMHGARGGLQAAVRMQTARPLAKAGLTAFKAKVTTHGN